MIFLKKMQNYLHHGKAVRYLFLKYLKSCLIFILEEKSILKQTIFYSLLTIFEKNRELLIKLSPFSTNFLNNIKIRFFNEI